MLFGAALARDEPLIIDGGLATELEAQGCDISNHLWSASLLLDQPGAIIAAHRAFLDAGAECIATASYQASREGFEQRGLSGEQADALMTLSVDLAATTVFRSPGYGLSMPTACACSMTVAPTCWPAKRFLRFPRRGCWLTCSPNVARRRG